MQARAAWRWARNFYPRPPRGGRRIVQPFRSKPFGFLSTPSARRATPAPGAFPGGVLISIHALREEGDRTRQAERGRRGNFYPRPPRGGRPVQARAAWRWARNFYPRPPRGGRRIVQPFRSKPFGFLSTPSARRATTYRKEQPSALTISIHALREEGDRLDTISNISRTHFYPRPPRGGRRTCGRHGQSLRHFYPRPPRGGRRPEQHYHFALEKFLSTPSARRATLSVLCSHFGCADFYPRPPRGGRPCVRLIRRRAKIFLSTPSARRATSHGHLLF